MNTNDKHREIAEKWKLTTVNVKDYDDKLLAFIAEVDQEGYERGVRESGKALAGLVHDGRNRVNSDEAYDAILSLIKPPKPVWEHKPDCPTPYQLVCCNGSKSWTCDSDEIGWVYEHGGRLRYCPGCGEPTPKE